MQVARQEVSELRSSCAGGNCVANRAALLEAESRARSLEMELSAAERQLDELSGALEQSCAHVEQLQQKQHDSERRWLRLERDGSGREAEDALAQVRRSGREGGVCSQVGQIGALCT